MSAQEESTPLTCTSSNEDCDAASEVSEAYCYKSKNTPTGYSFDAFRNNLSNLRCGMGRLFRLLAPTSLQNESLAGNDSITSSSLHPTAYLDGMRGLAALSVFLCHLSYTTWDIAHTYMAGDEQKSLETTSWLRLPIVRLFYSGPPMVAIFFVISGYSLSYKPLKQMRHADFSGLIQTLTSATFRRPFRLFLPCIVSTLIVVLLTRIGLYQYTEDFANNMPGVHEGHYWTAPTALIQLFDWLHKMLDFVNPFDWGLYAGSIDLDLHLWTIPVEFKCSLSLFITQLAVARMTVRARLSSLVLLMIWGTYMNRWEMVPFWAGITIAELEMMKPKPTPILVLEKDQAVVDASEGDKQRYKFMHCAILLAGLYFASYPDIEGHLSPGFRYLNSLIPDRFSEKHRFWPNIGAGMIVYSISNLDWAKRIFEIRLIQWLGAISFPLYVCHGFVIHTFGYALMDWLYETTNAYDDDLKFKQAYTLAAACTVLVTLAISDIFLRVVDVRSVKFARYLEKRLLR